MGNVVQFNKREKFLFENSAYLRLKFGYCYPFLKEIYSQVIDCSVEERDEILKRLEKTKIEYVDKSNQKYFDVFTNRSLIVNDGKIELERKVFITKDEEFNALLGCKTKRKAKISSSLFEFVYDDSKIVDNFKMLKQKNKIQQQFIHQYINNRTIPLYLKSQYNKALVEQNFIHQLLHAVSYASVEKFDDNNSDISFKKFVNYDDKLSVKFGVEQVGVFGVKFVKDTDLVDDVVLLHNEFINQFKEESIVEKWANEISNNLGVFDKLYKEGIVDVTDYGTLPFIEGMFNVVNNGEWRNQYITGRFAEKCSIEDAVEMDKLFKNYVLSIVDKNNNDFFDNDINLNNLIDCMVEIIDYCDSKFTKLVQENKLSEKQKQDFIEDRYMFLNSDNTINLIMGLSVQGSEKFIKTINDLECKIENEFHTEHNAVIK